MSRYTKLSVQQNLPKTSSSKKIKLQPLPNFIEPIRQDSFKQSIINIDNSFNLSMMEDNPEQEEEIPITYEATTTHISTSIKSTTDQYFDQLNGSNYDI